MRVPEDYEGETGEMMMHNESSSLMNHVINMGSVSLDELR
jgi:hypothetical protein